MVRYMSLFSFTEKGIEGVKDSVHRAGAFRQQVADAGGNIIGIYWATGQYDGFAIFEAPDDETAVALMASIGKHGYVRTHSMRIFDEAEFREITSRL